MARSQEIDRSVMSITSPLHSRVWRSGPEARLSQFFNCHKRVEILPERLENDSRVEQADAESDHLRGSGFEDE